MRYNTKKKQNADLLLFVLLTLFAAALAWALAGCTPAVAETGKVDEAPGQPLDATRHAAPAFASGSWCYRVVDRTTGATWWLVRMERGEGDSQWVTLAEPTPSEV